MCIRVLGDSETKACSERGVLGLERGLDGVLADVLETLESVLDSALNVVSEELDRAR